MQFAKLWILPLLLLLPTHAQLTSVDFIFVTGFRSVRAGKAGVWVLGGNRFHKLGDRSFRANKVFQGDVGTHDVVVVSNLDNKMRYRYELTPGEADYTWFKTTRSMKHVSLNSQDIMWAVESGGAVYRSISCKTWGVKVPGRKFTAITAGANTAVFGLDASGDIYIRDEMTSSNPIGTQWSLLLSGQTERGPYLAIDGYNSLLYISATNEVSMFSTYRSPSNHSKQPVGLPGRQLPATVNKTARSILFQY